MIGRRPIGAKGEGGFTLIEAIVAAMLVSLVSLAVMTAFDTARRATFRSEQSQVANDRAQNELEAIRRLPYASVALTSAPSSSTDPDDPRSRVSGSNFALSKDGSNQAALAVQGGSLQDGGTITDAAVDPGPTPFSSGDVKGKIYRFVTWRDDPNCLELICPGAQDLKRIVVIVALDPTAAGGSRSYIEVQSNLIDPEDSVISDVDPPDLGDLVVAQQFWLSDEHCTDTDEPPHSATLSSHSSRDTFGINCKSATSGRPDALVSTPPINTDQTLDFADELEPTPSTADSGLQFLLGDSSGCKFKPTGTNAYKTSHIWVTKKLPLDFAMTGGATLELWTRSINDISTSGSVCVILFTRLEDPLGVLPPTDVRIPDASTGNLFFTKTVSSWPAGKWKKIRIPMTFAPTTALLGQRLGVAVGLEKGATPTDQLMFQYDHIDLDSRLEVETTTPLLP